MLGWLAGLLVGALCIYFFFGVLAELPMPGVGLLVGLWVVVVVAATAAWVFAVVILLFVVLVCIVVVVTWLSGNDRTAQRDSPPKLPAAQPAGGVRMGGGYPRDQKPADPPNPRPVVKPTVGARSVGLGTPQRVRTANVGASATSAAAGHAMAPGSDAEQLVAKLANPVGRRACQTKLKQMGAPAVAPLVDALSDESLRPFAQVALIELGVLAEPKLRSAALHGSLAVRGAAEDTLDRMGR